MIFFHSHNHDDYHVMSFVSATGITNSTHINAITKLVADLKGSALWPKFKAIYPMIGGSANAHKFNLCDARDVDTAFRLSFVGTWTHNSSGAKSSSAYANTFLTPSSSLSQNSKHLSYWQVENSVSGGFMMGAQNSSDVGDALGPNYSGTDNYSCLSSSMTNIGATSNYSGLHTITRTSSSGATYSRNGIEKVADGKASSSNPAFQLFLGARNKNGSYLQPTNQTCAWASIGDGLTDAEVVTLHSIVSTFQTSVR